MRFHCVIVLSIDNALCGQTCDLLQPQNVSYWLSLIWEGKVLGVMAGRSCETWSVARFTKGLLEPEKFKISRGLVEDICPQLKPINGKTSLRGVGTQDVDPIDQAVKIHFKKPFTVPQLRKACSVGDLASLIVDLPPPVRSEDRPWGLTELSTKHREQVRVGSLLMLVAARFCLAAVRAGTASITEHPAESSWIPHAPSIFKLDI